MKHVKTALALTLIILSTTAEAYTGADKAELSSCEDALIEVATAGRLLGRLEEEINSASVTSIRAPLHKLVANKRTLETRVDSALYMALQLCRD